MKKSIELIIKPYIIQNPGEKDTSLADKIVDDVPNLGITHRTVRWYIKQIKDKLIVGDYSNTEDEESVDSNESDAALNFTTWSVAKEDDDVELLDDDLQPEDFNYKVGKDSNNNIVYIFSTNDGDVTILETLIDKTFCAYSRNGLNYTKQQVVNALGMSYRDFGLVTTKLNLNKYSKSLGPNSIAHLDDVAQYDKVIKITSELLDKFTESDNAVAESLIREYKKKVMSLSMMETIKEEQLKALVATLPSITIPSYQPDPAFITGYGDTLVVVLTDMHIGMENNVFNFEIAKTQMKTISSRVNLEVKLFGIKRVILILLGDLPHTISGLNHLNNWKDLEDNFWGAEAIIRPFELLAGLAANTPNLAGIYAVGGNHGRLNHSKEIEPSDEGEKLILYMLDKATPDSVEVKFDSEKMVYSSDNVNYISLHGDQGLDRQSGQEISWLLGSNDKYNLIMLGHLHSRIIKKGDDGFNFRKMHCPAFCPTDAYAERLGLRSTPGFLLIKETDRGLPSVTDVPLYYDPE